MAKEKNGKANFDSVFRAERADSSRVGSSRSGVEPPTGTIHPREGRGTTNEKQESRFISGDAFPDLELRGNIWRGWSFPVGGSTPDRLRNDKKNDKGDAASPTRYCSVNLAASSQTARRPPGKTPKAIVNSAAKNAIAFSDGDKTIAPAFSVSGESKNANFTTRK